MPQPRRGVPRVARASIAPNSASFPESPAPVRGEMTLMLAALQWRRYSVLRFNRRLPKPEGPME
jgi:hypothetical protein